MIAVDLTLEDCRLIAVSKPHTPDEPMSSDFDMIICDNMTGKEFRNQVTFLQLVNIVALGLHPDGMPEISTDEAYKIVAPALEGCPKECSPIP